MSDTAPAKERLDAATCSAVNDALAFIALGPQRGANAVEWFNLSMPMCSHCLDRETVNEAAARIIAAEFRKTVEVLEAIEEIYTDGDNTYEDWKAMGELARNALKSLPNTDYQTKL
jgi:hypothetical protein